MDLYTYGRITQQTRIDADMKTVTICGSMRFEEEMKRIAFALEANRGYNVLQCVYNVEKRNLTQNEIANLEEAHFRKIELSDAIYVVDIGGYIGNQVKKEIAYAKEHGKEIIYYSKAGETK